MPAYQAKLSLYNLHNFGRQYSTADRYPGPGLKQKIRGLFLSLFIYCSLSNPPTCFSQVRSKERYCHRYESVEPTTAWPSSRAASIYSRLCRKRCFLAAASALRPCSQQLIRTTFSFPVPCFSRNRQPPIAIYFELCFSFILSADYGSIRPVTVTTLLSIKDIATKAHRSALVDPSLCKTTAKEQSTPTRSSFPVPTIVPTAQFCCFPFLPFFLRVLTCTVLYTVRAHASAGRPAHSLVSIRRKQRRKARNSLAPSEPPGHSFQASGCVNGSKSTRTDHTPHRRLHRSVGGRQWLPKLRRV